MSIYACFCCGGPIIFRGSKPQVYHIPSGWHCWEMQKKGLCGSDKPVAVYIPSTTKKSERERLLKDLIDMYKKYLKTGNPSKVMEFIRYLLKNNHGDVVRDFIAHIIKKRRKNRNKSLESIRNKFLESIVESEEWQEFVTELQTNYLYRKYMSIGDPSLAFSFVGRQVKAQHSYRVNNMLSYIRNQTDITGIVTEEMEYVYAEAASHCEHLDKTECFNIICDLIRKKIELLKSRRGTPLKRYDKKILVSRINTMLLEFIMGYRPEEGTPLELFKKLIEKWKEVSPETLARKAALSVIDNTLQLKEKAHSLFSQAEEQDLDVLKIKDVLGEADALLEKAQNIGRANPISAAHMAGEAAELYEQVISDLEALLG